MRICRSVLCFKAKSLLSRKLCRRLSLPLDAIPSAFVSQIAFPRPPIVFAFHSSLKIVAAGISMFISCRHRFFTCYNILEEFTKDNNRDAPNCRYRITTEGLPTLLPFLSEKRIVRFSLSLLLELLEKNCIDAVPGPLLFSALISPQGRTPAKEMDRGSLVVVLEGFIAIFPLALKKVNDECRHGLQSQRCKCRDGLACKSNSPADGPTSPQTTHDRGLFKTRIPAEAFLTCPHFFFEIKKIK